MGVLNKQAAVSTFSPFPHAQATHAIPGEELVPKTVKQSKRTDRLILNITDSSCTVNSWKIPACKIREREARKGTESQCVTGVRVSGYYLGASGSIRHE